MLKSVKSIKGGIDMKLKQAAAQMDAVCNNQNRLLLQFHITGRCNLRCKHCYRTEGDVELLQYEDIVRVIEQFNELRQRYNSRHRSLRKGHVNITGGEPFIRKDIQKILKLLGENREFFTYGVLSNGSFIDEKLIGLLKETGVSFVQLSLDGNRQTHDALRAPGDYDRVLNTAQWLERSGIRTYISFTANRDNYRQLPQVAKECRKRRITKLWSDRLVPIGNGQDIADLAIGPELLPDYIKTMKKARGNVLERVLHPKTQVTMNRALQFLDSDGQLYSCSAGNSLITVDEFGRIMPCRRMPIPCGTVFETTLTSVYYENEVFQKLRARDIPKECARCPYVYRCRGGARCQSYGTYGSFYRADPACPLAQKTSPEQSG